MKLFAVWIAAAFVAVEGAAVAPGIAGTTGPVAGLGYATPGADRSDLVPVGLETFNSPGQLIGSAPPGAKREVPRRPAERRRGPRR